MDGCIFALAALGCFIGPAVAAYFFQVNVIFCFPVTCGC